MSAVDIGEHCADNAKKTFNSIYRERGSLFLYLIIQRVKARVIFCPQPGVIPQFWLLMW